MKIIQYNQKSKQNVVKLVIQTKLSSTDSIRTLKHSTLFNIKGCIKITHSIFMKNFQILSVVGLSKLSTYYKSLNTDVFVDVDDVMLPHFREDDK